MQGKERLKKKKGFSPQAVVWSQQRAQAFSKATQRKGLPMTYGHGKPPEDKKR